MKLKISSWTEDDFIDLPRGTYIRTTHGEGKVGDKLPTGSRIVKTVDKVERKLSYDDVTAIWDKSSKAWKKVEASMKLKKAYGSGLIISPRSLIQRALLIGVITPEEANSRAIKDAAQEQAEFVTDTWTEGEGIGSSDMNAFTYSMLQSAGIEVDWTTGRMIRKDKVAAEVRPENARMMEFLAKHGIKCQVKYIWNGSLRGTWRLYNKNEKWTPELMKKLTDLRFKGFDRNPLTEYSGNGGVFSVFVRGHDELLEDATGAGEPDVEKTMMAKTYPGILSDPSKNRELWGEIEEAAAELVNSSSYAEGSVSVETQLANREARRLAAKYLRWYHDTILMDTAQERELAITIKDYIWEEYNDRVDGRTASKKASRVSTMYTPVISEALKAMKRTDINPNLVEGYLRLDHGTLDGLSREQIRKEIPSIVSEIDDDPETAKKNARTYNLQASNEVFLSAVNHELAGILGSTDMNESKIADKVASKVVAGMPRWINVTHMRKDIDEMAAQIGMQLAAEVKMQQEDPGGMDFTRDFKRAQTLLDECSDKLRLLEGNI